jgi:hypothetical protein
MIACVTVLTRSCCLTSASDWAKQIAQKMNVARCFKIVLLLGILGGVLSPFDGDSDYASASASESVAVVSSSGVRDCIPRLDESISRSFAARRRAGLHTINPTPAHTSSARNGSAVKLTCERLC